VYRISARLRLAGLFLSLGGRLSYGGGYLFAKGPPFAQ
jgi:hypothetical protein